MKTFFITLFFFACLALPALAGDFSQEELIGQWEFMYWAENAEPDKKHSVNMIMDFKPNGSIINIMKNSKTTATYTLQGETLVYKDKNGQQNWKMLSFIPGKEMKVSQMGTIMFFEKR